MIESRKKTARPLLPTYPTAIRATTGSIILASLLLALSQASSNAAEGLISTNWMVRLPIGSSGSPAVAPGGTVYFGAGSTNLIAVSSSGQSLWTNALAVVSSPAIAPDGTIYVGTYDSRFFSLSPDGKTNWVIQTDPLEAKNRNSTPAIAADGMIYFLSMGHGLYACNPDGTIRWQLTNTFVASGEAQFPAPSIGPDGTIYFGWVDGKFYTVNPDGTKRGEYTAGAQFLGSPAIGSDGTAYIGSDDQKFYAFTADGTKKFELSPEGTRYIESSPCIGPDGTIYYAPLSSHVFAARPDGSIRWDLAAGSVFSGSPALSADGTLWIADLSLGLLSVNTAMGEELLPPYLTANLNDSSPAITDDGSIYVATQTILYSLKGSAAPAASAWPMYRHDAARTGRALQQSMKLSIGADGTSVLKLNTEVGLKYVVESSNDLKQWSSIAEMTTTNTAPVVPISAAQAQAFYRLKLGEQER